jgi:hypothetical protein
MSYHGDIRLGDTIDVKFTTTSATTGAPTQLAGTPVISAYVGNGTTQITAGITLTVDFDSVTGLNNVRVVASSGNGYATATNVQLVITTGTVGGTSAVGYVIGEFSIEARSALMPTTATRTLDVTATGAAGIDWGNVENPTTALNLSATNIDVDQVVATVTNQLTAAQIATSVWQDATAGDFTTASSIGKSLYTGNIVPGAAGGHFIAGTNAATSITTALTANITGNITGNLSGSVGSVTGAVGSVTALANNSITAAALATDAVTEIQTGLATPTNITAGTITTATNVTTVNGLAANVITAASTAADYVTEMQAGLATAANLAAVDTVVDAIKVTTDQFVFTVPNQVDANALTGGGGLDAAGVRNAVGLATANLDTQLSTIDTAVDAVKVKTDPLTFTKANELDSNIQSVNDVTVAGTGAPGDEWGP